MGARKNRTNTILPLDARDPPETLAAQLLADFWPGVDAAAFASGSWRRGQATATSDIDLVVILPDGVSGPPSRKSFIAGGWPVEMFVHDRATLADFMASDHARAMPSLMTMIRDGAAIPGADHPAITHARDAAAQWLATPPPALSMREIEDKRYFLTDQIDDLAAPRDPAEILPIVLKLAPALADFRLRSSGHFSGEGKALMRAFTAVLPEDCTAWHSATMAALQGKTQTLISLAEDWMQPHGGRLFAGYERSGDAKSAAKPD